MKEAKLDWSSISDVVIVGVETMIPFSVTQNLLRNIFPVSQFHTSINPGEVVATGAAIVAARLTADKNLNFDIVV